MRFFKLLGLLFFSVALFMLLLEVGARFIWSGQLPPELADMGCNSGFAFDHYATYSARPCDNDSALRQNNNLGIRRHEHTERKKPPHTFRILLAGGSTVWGQGGTYSEIQKGPHFLNWDKTIDYQLEQQLEKDFPGMNFEVLNIGAIGYWVHHHLLRYISFGQYLEPDMMIAMDGYNDYFHAGPGFEEFYRHPYLENFTQPITNPSPLSAFFVFADWLGQYSYAAQVLSRVYHRADNIERAAQEERELTERRGPNAVAIDNVKYSEAFNDQILRIYRELAALCTLNGTSFVLAYQPILLLRERESLTEVEQRMWDFTAGSGPQQREHMLELAKLHIPILEAWTQRAGVPFINLQEETKQCKKQLFTDYCHLTQEAGMEIAQIFAKRLHDLIAAKIAHAA